MREAIVTAAIVVAVVVVGYAGWRLLRSRLPDEVAQLVRQLVPVVILAALVVAALVLLDPDQADVLVESTIRYIPRAVVALIVVILARALGRILGAFAEATFRRISPLVGSRARMAVSSVILLVGIIIALQQLGVSTNILILLIGALAGAVALAAGLAVGLGSLPVARQLAAGRHVQDRLVAGQRVQVGPAEGVVVSIGLATTVLEGADGARVEVPHEVFLQGPVTIHPVAAESASE